MKKTKVLLPIILFATLALSGCTGNVGSKTSSEQKGSESQQTTESSEQSSQEQSSESSETVVYGVEIANKADLTAEWHVKENSRELEISLAPEANVLLELAKKNLTITSSNPEVVSINGVVLSAVGEGTATITVTYHDKTDTVEISVLPEKGEPDHVVATVEQILANLEESKEKDVIYEIQAYVVAWQSGKTDATKYGNYMLADSMEEGAPQILVYGSSANTEAFKIEWKGSAYEYTQGDDAKDFLTNEVTKDVGIGSKLTMEVIAYKYGTTSEVSGIVKAADNSGVEHHDYPEPAVVNATMEEVWANEQGNGKVKFHVTGVKLKSFADNTGAPAADASKYGNALLGENGEYFAYGLTATASALAWSSEAGMYAFTNPKDFLENETTKDLVAGAVVDLDLIRADYGDKKEVTGVITNVVSNGEGGGEQEEVPEPAVADRTLAEFIAGENTKAVAYNVTAEIKAFKNGATKDKYGNMTLTDGTNDLVVYGATMTGTALAWNKADAYTFTNPQDFMSNETSNALAIGDTITMKMIRCDYTKDGTTTIEGQGVITNIESAPAEQPLPLKDTTRVQGADIFVYLDNSVLNLPGDAGELATIEVGAKDFLATKTDTSPDDANNYVTGGAAAIVLGANPSFAYANPTEALLYVHLDKGVPDAWNMKFMVTVTITTESGVYTSTLTFIGGALQA